jgi:hypothetical protein
MSNNPYAMAPKDMALIGFRLWVARATEAAAGAEQTDKRHGEPIGPTCDDANVANSARQRADECKI